MTLGHLVAGVYDATKNRRPFSGAWFDATETDDGRQLRGSLDFYQNEEKPYFGAWLTGAWQRGSDVPFTAEGVDALAAWLLADRRISRLGLRVAPNCEPTEEVLYFSYEQLGCGDTLFDPSEHVRSHPVRHLGKSPLPREYLRPSSYSNPLAAEVLAALHDDNGYFALLPSRFALLPSRLSRAMRPLLSRPDLSVQLECSAEGQGFGIHTGDSRDERLLRLFLRLPEEMVTPAEHTLVDYGFPLEGREYHLWRQGGVRGKEEIGTVRL